MNTMLKPVAAIVVILGCFLFLSSLYVVDETEQVVVTRFGRIIGEPVVSPGLNFKVPFLDKANYFPKNLLSWDGEQGQVPTKDKTFIWVDMFARWRIQDPVLYFQTVRDEFSAMKRLDDIIEPAMRNEVTSHPLVESVRNTDRPMDTFETGDDSAKRIRYKIDLGRDEINRLILEQAKEKLLDFGIELVDVKIKRINYIENVRTAVYGRMIAERNQIAEKFRAEGQGEASNIRGEKEKDLQVIKSEAYKVSQKIKGDADAEAAKIYAEAYNADPEFYAFLKTLEVYRDIMQNDSTLILSTDSDFMKYFKGINQ